MSDPRLEAVKAAAQQVKESGVHSEDVQAAMFLAMLDAALSVDDEDDEVASEPEYVVADAEPVPVPDPDPEPVPEPEPEPVPEPAPEPAGRHRRARGG